MKGDTDPFGQGTTKGDNKVQASVNMLNIRARQECRVRVAGARDVYPGESFNKFLHRKKVKDHVKICQGVRHFLTMLPVRGYRTREGVWRRETCQWMESEITTDHCHRIDLIDWREVLLLNLVRVTNTDNQKFASHLLTWRLTNG